MASVPLVATCDPAYIDASTGQCSQVVWTQQTLLGFPPLSATQGFEISGAIAALWGLGFLVRVLRKTTGV